RIRRQFEVNTLGPLRVTKALMARLGRGSKVAIVSSWMGSLAENTAGGSYGYRISKCAVNMAGLNLAHDLRPQGIAVVLLHPGYVSTDMTGGGGTVDPEDAARGLIARIDALTLDKTGTFWHAEGHELPW
ncbi:MAG: SDR family NAD(P)-dependent oxidoreductase, partial [Methyloligellaceae bacterium]